MTGSRYFGIGSGYDHLHRQIVICEVIPMHTDKKFHFLAERLSQILGFGKIIDIREASMDSLSAFLKAVKNTALSAKKQTSRKEW